MNIEEEKDKTTGEPIFKVYLKYYINE